MNETQPTLVIPVCFEDERLVIVSCYPSRREMLTNYLLQRPEMVNSGNVTDVIVKLLLPVYRAMARGTQIYEMNFAGLTKKVGRLVFVMERVTDGDGPKTWPQIERDIDGILADAERQNAGGTNT